MRRRRPDIEYLLDRAESVRFRPCIQRALKRAHVRAKVTITREGYLAVRAATKADYSRLGAVKAQVEKRCKL